MSEFIVIVESSADAITVTKLAERVLVETIEWLESENLKYHFKWCGLEENTEHSCWSDINKIINDAKTLFNYKPPRFLGHSRDKIPFKADGASASKVLNLVRFLQKTRSIPIRAILLIRDLDNQPERKEGLKQARLEHINRHPKLEIVIGAADRMRESWVLNGFIALDKEEEKRLEIVKNKLTFDPCNDSHKLRSNSSEEPERMRNPKFVLKLLTNKDREREKQCWEETSLKFLKERGVNTGLTDYINEIEQRLVPILESE